MLRLEMGAYNCHVRSPSKYLEYTDLSAMIFDLNDG